MARQEPYGSAADIPSIADMLQKIEGGKLLTRFIARDQRAKLVELERQVRQHVTVIDRFYAVLGPRNWIVHDELPMPLLTAIGGMAADDGERQLIGYYQDPETWSVSPDDSRTPNCVFGHHSLSAPRLSFWPVATTRACNCC